MEFEQVGFTLNEKTCGRKSSSRNRNNFAEVNAHWRAFNCLGWNTAGFKIYWFDEEEEQPR